ncbi:MAG: chitobiase/beta-hexosaminidase C-terminal domain-containing protein [Marinoscillum sp.]
MKALLTLTILTAVIVSCNDEMDDRILNDVSTPFYPTYSFESDTYSEDIKLEIHSKNRDATIFYTLDGTEPNLNSLKYVNPIEITGDGTELVIKAIAIQENLGRSIVTESFYKIDYHYLPAFHIESLDLTAYNEKMVGRWVGHVKTPWTDPYNIKLKIQPDGTYSARTLSPYLLPESEIIEHPAFYYGTDADFNEKQLELEFIDADGFANGEIQIVFDEEVTNKGAIKNLRFYHDYNIMKFEFWHRYHTGPLEYKFTRIE